MDAKPSRSSPPADQNRRREWTVEFSLPSIHSLSFSLHFFRAVGAYGLRLIIAPIAHFLFYSLYTILNSHQLQSCHRRDCSLQTSIFKTKERNRKRKKRTTYIISDLFCLSDRRLTRASGKGKAYSRGGVTWLSKLPFPPPPQAVVRRSCFIVKSQEGVSENLILSHSFICLSSIVF